MHMRHARAAVVSALATLTVAVGGCEERTARDREREADGASLGEVVVYCSADAPVAEAVLDAFEKNTGARVRAVFDTEATKTTGLVNRLLSEHENKAATADVWWSSEPFGTIRLARAGVLAKYTSAAGESSFAGGAGWPEALRGDDGTWYGFSPRLRVLVYNTRMVKPEDLPEHLHQLTETKFKDRVAMARPEFGTTRGHMAAIQMLSGGNGLEPWLRDAAANGLRLYDGNASVVRAVAGGEVWVGLTDTDDVINGAANGWPVAWAAISNVPRAEWSMRGASGPGAAALFPEQAMQVPQTVALVAGGRSEHRAAAEALVDFLLSEEAESLLAASEFHALALRRKPLMPGEEVALRADGLPASVMASELDLERVAEFVEPAMRVCGEVLEGR